MVKQLTLFDPIELPLTQGYVALIDPVDADLTNVKWYAHRTSHGYCYATRKDGTVTHLLHRIVLERIIGRSLSKSEVTDHISGDTLDNRRSNLRVATVAQNRFNAKLNSTNTSGYKGVSWHKRSRKWQAMIEVGEKNIYLGRYDDPQKAYAAYCEAAQKYAGEFARLI